MTNSLSENTRSIYQEMMSHPALFSHAKPNRIALLSTEASGVEIEILKHPTVIELTHITPKTPSSGDTRLRHYSGSVAQWLEQAAEETFDIIIAENLEKKNLAKLYTLLDTSGILLQCGESPFAIQAIKEMQQALHHAGFTDAQTLNFPQPVFPTGWKTAWMAKKEGILRRVREKDIFNKSFTTHYYNLDVHKAALALPEFMRVELHTEE